MKKEFKFDLEKLRHFGFFVFMFYLLFYVPFSFVVYSSYWYEFNFERQDVSLDYGLEKSLDQGSNLILFFLHMNEMNENWSETEKKHMTEVRGIYDKMFFFFVLSFLGFFVLFDKRNFFRFAKYNIYVFVYGVLFFVLFLMFFSFDYFWANIFHPLLFDNLNWVIGEDDVSYYIFPIEFFINSILFVWVFFLLENLLVLFFVKRSFMGRYFS